MLVNDQVIEKLPAFVDPRSDVVIVDGERVQMQRLEYWVLHKPKGVVCTDFDPARRTRAIDLLPQMSTRLFVVGRLDAESTGLLLLTNDGELAARVTHPRYGIQKRYRAEVRAFVPDEVPSVLREGVHLAEGKARAAGVQIVHRTRDRSVLELTLREGRNRQVRRMLAKLGFPVTRLKRIEIGPLALKGLPLGASRRLTAAEVHALRAATEQAAERAEQRGAEPHKRRRRKLGAAPRESAARDSSSRDVAGRSVVPRGASSRGGGRPRPPAPRPGDAAPGGRRKQPGTPRRRIIE